MLEFRILGPLEVVADGEPVSLPRKKQRALLALLLLRAGEAVSTDELIEELWAGQPPATAKDALQNYVSQLRKALGPEVIVTRDPGYLLEATAEQTDLGRFERLVAEARGGDAQRPRGEAARGARALARAAARRPRLRVLHRARGGEARGAARVRPGGPRRRRARAGPPRRARRRAGDDDRRASLRRAPARPAHARPLPRRQAGGRARGLPPGSAHARRGARARAGRAAARARAGDPAPGHGARRAARRSGRARGAAQDGHDPLRRPRRVDRARGGARPRALRRVLDGYFAAARRAIEGHGGTIEKFIGDAVMAVFGVPVAHEDDALRAVRAAVDTRAAVAALERGGRARARPQARPAHRHQHGRRLRRRPRPRRPRHGQCGQRRQADRAGGAVRLDHARRRDARARPRRRPREGRQAEQGEAAAGLPAARARRRERLPWPAIWRRSSSAAKTSFGGCSPSSRKRRASRRRRSWPWSASPASARRASPTS